MRGRTLPSSCSDAPFAVSSLVAPLFLRSALSPYGFFAVESVVAAPASFDWIDWAFWRCAWIVGCALTINALSDVSCAELLAVCSRFNTAW